jgi:hypothetical protein
MPAAAAAAAPPDRTSKIQKHLMQDSPQWPVQAPDWRRGVLVLSALFMLAGCASNGDFNEAQPYLVRDDVHDFVAVDAIAGRHTFPSQFELTDDERSLRDLAFPLIQPPYDRHQWYSILQEYGVTGSDHRTGFDRTAYTTNLFSEQHRSPSSRYAKLTEDIRNDIERMPQFFEAAGRVLDVDQKRRKSFAFIRDLSAAERTNAQRRIHENELIIAWVCGSLADRAAGYRFALERLVIMAPSPEAADVERTLNEMRGQIARYRVAPAPHALEQSLANAR